MPAKESEKPAHSQHQAFLAIEPKHRIPDTVNKQIAKVHKSIVRHWGLQKCKDDKGKIHILVMIDAFSRSQSTG